jgi:hypothetical protein
MTDSEANLWTVEAAFGDRPHEITYSSNSKHLQLRTNSELWIKENMLNVLISRLPQDWEYVATIDADVTFLNNNWVNETIQQLQHYPVVQMFEDAIDLGPKGEVMAAYSSFASSINKGIPYGTKGDVYAGKGYVHHPGYAWAYTKDAFNHLGGLIDFAVIGAGDHHQALSYIGEATKSLPGGIHQNYVNMVLEWQSRAKEHHIMNNIGYVPGTLAHHWHGKKNNRKYIDRWAIIQKHQFDPMTDIKKDYQGLHQLTVPGYRMRNDLRDYFRQREEDSIER